MGENNVKEIRYYDTVLLTYPINALNEMFENISMVICYHFSYIYRLHPEY